MDVICIDERWSRGVISKGDSYRVLDEGETVFGGTKQRCYFILCRDGVGRWFPMTRFKLRLLPSSLRSKLGALNKTGEPVSRFMTVKVEEEQRQLLMLAIAELALSRPGWDTALGDLADAFHGRGMFDGFKKTSADKNKSEAGSDVPAQEG